MGMGLLTSSHGCKCIPSLHVEGVEMQTRAHTRLILMRAEKGSNALVGMPAEGVSAGHEEHAALIVQIWDAE